MNRSPAVWLRPPQVPGTYPFVILPVLTAGCGRLMSAEHVLSAHIASFPPGSDQSVANAPVAISPSKLGRLLFTHFIKRGE